MADAIPSRPLAWLRHSSAPPAPLELDRLARLARSAPLWGAAPDPLLLHAFPPLRPLARRNAAVDWRIARGTPGDTVLVRLRDPGGILDSARITLDAAGQAAGSFRVSPASSGWHAWQLQAGDATAPAGAWVAPAEPLRILIGAGPGSLEARETARALERGGAEVTLATDLGRGLRLGDAPDNVPPTSEITAFDVVILLPGLDLLPPHLATLRNFLHHGGGVLAAGPPAAAFGVRVGPPAPASGRDLNWSAPAGIEPLPPAEIVGTIAPLAPPPSFHPAASTDDATLLALGQDGRGRRAALGLLETWRWSLDAGRTESHAAFWSSLAGWLAGGGRAPFTVWADPATAAPGVPVRLRVARLDPVSAPPGHLLLVYADGARDSLPLAWSGDEGTTRFVARDSGLVRVHLPGDTVPAAAHLADPSGGPAPDAWAQLAKIARASGGRLVPADSLDDVVRGPASRFPWRASLLVLCMLVACADWASRRLHGRA